MPDLDVPLAAALPPAGSASAPAPAVSPTPAVASPGPTAASPAPTAAASPLPPPSPTPAGWQPRHTLAAFGLLALFAGAGFAFAWQARDRVRSLEQELVRRLQDTQAQSAEARLIAKQAQDGTRDTAAKMALVEARVAEVAVQRGQIDELIQSLSRSRDENLLVDIDTAVRMALQQSVLTGSTEPLVVTLRQADERLARHNQPRLDGVRRAVARDLDRVRAVAVADAATLGIKLDEAVRLVDELPLVAQAESLREVGRGPTVPGPRLSSASARPVAAAASAAMLPAWLAPWAEASAAFSAHVWNELRSLVRVTRIDRPEAVLLAPEQAFFLRENLKLRLLNARLGLLARQFETAQGDLQSAQRALDRYFDRSSRRTALMAELLKQVAEQARHVAVPRPDDTLSALSAAAAGR